MSLRILYSAENLAELFQVELSNIRTWTRIGILPSLEGYSPIRYDKEEIDAWLDDGRLEKHRPMTYHHRKGFWSKPKK